MRKVKKYGIYRHFKGRMYIVIDTCKNSETLEDYVLYRALYDDNELWIRPLDMFLEEVDKKKYPNIKQKYRFQELEISSSKS